MCSLWTCVVEHPVKARTTKEQKSGITICLEIMVIKYEKCASPEQWHEKRSPTGSYKLYVILRSEAPKTTQKASMPQGECRDRACTGMAEPFGKTQSVNVATMLAWA